jgi:hypothetical protein
VKGDSRKAGGAVTKENDDVLQVVIDNLGDMIAHTWKWIRDNEGEVERLAAETGQRQQRTIGIAMDSADLLLEVQITCEPRQFATCTTRGDWSKLFKLPGG